MEIKAWESLSGKMIFITDGKKIIGKSKNLILSSSKENIFYKKLQEILNQQTALR